MVSANKIEILRIAESVAQEKMIDKTIVISALEEAIAKAAKSNYGEENEVVVEINQEDGDISISRKMLVVDEVKNKFLEITLKAAKKINGAAQIGDQLLDPLPPLDFGRIAAQSAKQVIIGLKFIFVGGNTRNRECFLFLVLFLLASSASWWRKPVTYALVINDWFVCRMFSSLALRKPEHQQ